MARDLDDVVLSRECRIEPIGGGASELLTVDFLRPHPVDSETLLGSVRMSCQFFEEVVALKAGDDLQAISMMMSVAWSCLKGQELRGYRIYWMEMGDLDYFDFWSYQPKPHQFAPPSAIQRARPMPPSRTKTTA